MLPLVQIDQLRVSYGNFEAIAGVTLEILAGHVVAVVGPNGAGKTTLFRSLFGELPKQAGSVRVCGLDPFAAKDRRQLWSVARWVTDAPALYEHLTVREFLEFSARAYGVPEPLIGAVTSDVAMNLGLIENFGRRIKALSFGNQRKVHVAAGFFSGASGPKVLVLDEPTIGMDPPSRLVLAQVLRQYVNPGAVSSERAVLVSSHNLAELSSVADYVVMINAGRIVASGPIHELAGRFSSDLAYELTLFDDQAPAMAAALQQNLALECQVKGARTIAFRCPDAQAVQQVVNYLGRPQTPFRVREMKEELSSLERVFIEGMDGS